MLFSIRTQLFAMCLAIFANPLAALDKDAVKCVQNQMAAAGYNPGPATGVVNERVFAALKAYQAATGVISQRGFSKQSALVYCRLIGLRAKSLRKYWHPRSGELDIVVGDKFRQSGFSSTQTVQKITRAHNSLKRRIGTSLAAPIVFIVAGSSGEAIALHRKHTSYNSRNTQRVFKRACQQGVGGVAFPDVVVLCVTRNKPELFKKNPTIIEFIAVHELFHTYQRQLAGLTRAKSEASYIKNVGPIWMIEGSAEYVAISVLYNASLEKLKAISRKSIKGPVPALSKVDGLADREKRGRTVYDVGVLAIANLLGTSNPQKLASFYENLGRVNRWQDAFQMTFGIPYKGFEARFARTNP